jgi:hypothetical protein
MTGADMQSYHRSPGAVLNAPVLAGDLDARATMLLDQRDSDHLRDYGHKPGDLQCTLPGREAYEQAVRVQLAESRCLVPYGAETSQAQGIIRGLFPGSYIPDPTIDADLNAARREMADRIDALQVIRG